MNAPYISLTMICGDDGAAGLVRLFESLLYRPDGCPFDEVILGWNGKNDDNLVNAVKILTERGLILQGIAAAYRPVPGKNVGDTTELALKGNVPFKILRQEWSNFATARNEVLALARGEWWSWLDTDDILSSVADTHSPDGLKAINEIEATYNVPLTAPDSPSSGTLKDWLKSLAWNVNCILTPYDYAISPDGKALVRQFMRRVMRRNANWVWHTPDGVHELPYPTGATAEIPLQTFGLLVRHYPNQESQDRLKRNREIIEKMTQPGNFADSRHAYDLSTMHIGTGDWAKADEAIRMAIAKSGNDEDTFNYRVVRVGIKLNVGQYEQALGEAFAAVSLCPERPEGYFLASECFYLMGNRWKACAHWYEEGRTKKLVPQSIDLVVNRVVKTRALAAHAYCELGNVERAFELAKEALEALPLDALAQRIFKKCAHDRAKKRAVDGVMDAVEFLLSQNDRRTAEELVLNTKAAVPLRGVTSLPRFQLVDAMVKNYERPPANEVPAQQCIEFEKRQLEGFHTTWFDGAERAVDAEDLVDGYFGSRQIGEIAEVEPGTSKGFFLSTKPTGKPIINIYAPHTVGVWDPTTIETYPLGGSESAVIYLSRELAKRGYPIRLFCPGGGANPKAEKGIVWYGLHQFDATAFDAGAILVAHRCPWVLRNPMLKAQTYIWHQDNGYGNPWNWSNEVVARAAGNFHVSEWAKRGLLGELGPGASEAGHHVIGNGVCPEWALSNRAQIPDRGTRKIIYASDPTRGLETLLNCWPKILERFPDAELHLFSDFAVTNAMIISQGIAVPATKFVSELSQRMHNTPRVFSHGRVCQKELTDAMLQASIYAYAGGAMPEGYGIALAQASAAGMQVVFPEAGALPEVLPNHDWMVPPVLSESGAEGFLAAVLDALAHPMPTLERIHQAKETLECHDWARVADRFEDAVFGRDAKQKEVA